jgi:hypothetical protein
MNSKRMSLSAYLASPGSPAASDWLPGKVLRNGFNEYRPRNITHIGGHVIRGVAVGANSLADDQGLAFNEK